MAMNRVGNPRRRERTSAERVDVIRTLRMMRRMVGRDGCGVYEAWIRLPAGTAWQRAHQALLQHIRKGYAYGLIAHQDISVGQSMLWIDYAIEAQKKMGART